MKYIVCLAALLFLLGLASAGYISHGWSSPVIVRRVYYSGYGGYGGGYRGWRGGYGGWSGGYGGWRGGYGGWW